ncbi:MAG: hypothetical protein O6944_08195 [Gammaproteobacteria bacterium]|nr:hypothetical protein [Gammaproteobacteria bacterium]
MAFGFATFDIRYIGKCVSTGNKTVRTRKNARSRAANRAERRGGKRKGAGQPKKRPSSRKATETKLVRKDIRSEYLELMEVAAKKNKQHRLQVFVDILHDKKWEKFRSTNAGGKAVSQLIDVVFFNQSGGRALGPGIPLPTGEGGEDDPELSGPPKLRPMEPDPARLVPFKPDDE